MYSGHGRVIVDNMSEFEHSSSRASCTFSMQDSRVKRGSTTGHQTQQARLPANYVLHNSTFPSLVNCILTIPECSKRSPWLVYNHSTVQKKRLLSLCHPRASLGSNRALKVVRQVGQPVSQISYRLLLLLCSFFLLIALALLIAVMIRSS